MEIRIQDDNLPKKKTKLKKKPAKKPVAPRKPDAKSEARPKRKPVVPPNCDDPDFRDGASSFATDALDALETVGGVIGGVLNKARDAVINVVDSATGEIIDVGEDVHELYKLKADFEAISNTVDYFDKHGEELGDIGPIDVLWSTDEVLNQIEGAGTQLVKAIKALENIEQTNLRFSKEFLGEAIAMLNDRLEDLKGTSISTFREIMDVESADDWNGIGWESLDTLLDDEKMEGLTRLAKDLKAMERVIAAIQDQLKKLTDPSIKGQPSNNRFVNIYLKGKKTTDEAEEEYEDIKDKVNSFKEIIDAIEKYG